MTIDPDTYNCPLLDRKTCFGECYEIQMVRGRTMKEESLGFKFDFERADELCVNCSYNQLPGVRVGEWRKYVER